MKNFFGLLLIVFCINLHAAEELSVGQVADDIFKRMDEMGIKSDKTLFLTASNPGMTILREEITPYVAAILKKVAAINKENRKLQDIQQILIGTSKVLLEVKKSDPLTFKIGISGVGGSRTITLVIDRDHNNVVIDGFTIELSSKFNKVVDDSSRTEFKNYFFYHEQIGKEPNANKIQER